MNRSLDLTIDALGRDRVMVELQRHQKYQKIAEEQCKSKAHFPCSANGTYQPQLSKHSCYENDFGCGHKCIYETLMPYIENDRLESYTTQSKKMGEDFVSWRSDW